MNASVSIALLSTFILLALPCKSQEDQHVYSKSLYKSIEPAIRPPLSAALPESVETENRIPDDVGKGIPEPKIRSFPMIKKTGAVTAVMPPVASGPAERSVRASSVTVLSDRSAAVAPNRATPASVPNPPEPFRTVNGSNRELIRAMDVKLVDRSDMAYMKKYAIVLGAFSNFSNAEFVKRTFNGLGERTVVVKNSSGLYYSALGGYDTETEAIRKLEEITGKYMEGVSKTKRISRFGIPFDDLWILELE
ncbi:MAG: SPOR domain-containing protein [Prevotella sp.]|jgi:hypothetical protein|nr:SPOR domain-containing protein [Prevotella sp.]